MEKFLRERLEELAKERAECERRKTEVFSSISSLNQQLTQNNILIDDYSEELAKLKSSIKKLDGTIAYYNSSIESAENHLEGHKKVKSVHYPGLSSSSFNTIAKKQFGKKIGGLLTFDLSSKKECFKFMDGLKLIRRSTNLNDNRTLILHPSSTIFCEYDDAVKKEMNVRETMIRLSVGIEHADDLIADIEEALKGI